MKNFRLTFTRLGITVALASLIFSCSKDKEEVNTTTLTAAEVKTILETDDISGIADTALSELISNNTTTGKSVLSNDCYSAAYTDTGFTATFTNCSLNGTNNINGIISVSYGTQGDVTTYVATYSDFYVGNIKINGTRTFVAEGASAGSSITFTINSAMTIDMGNGSVITENGDKIFTIVFGETLADSSYNLNGQWTLQHDSDTYKVNITDTLVASLTCGYIGSGSMLVNKNDLEITVSFGDGTCDDIAEITYPNGTVEQISLKD